MGFLSNLLGGAPGSGVRGAMGTALRSVGAGVETIAGSAAVEAERAMQVPHEGVIAGTMTLRDATANVPVVNKATRLLDKVAGVALLASTANLVQGYAQPGQTISSIAHRAADLIDGPTTDGFPTPGLDSAKLLRASDTRELLAALGIQ